MYYLIYLITFYINFFCSSINQCQLKIEEKQKRQFPVSGFRFLGLPMLRWRLEPVAWMSGFGERYIEFCMLTKAAMYLNEPLRVTPILSLFRIYIYKHLPLQTHIHAHPPCTKTSIPSSFFLLFALLVGVSNAL